MALFLTSCWRHAGGCITVVFSTKGGLFLYWRIPCQNQFVFILLLLGHLHYAFVSGTDYSKWLEKKKGKGNCAPEGHNMRDTVMSGSSDAESYKYAHMPIPIHIEHLNQSILERVMSILIRDAELFQGKISFSTCSLFLLSWTCKNICWFNRVFQTRTYQPRTFIIMLSHNDYLSWSFLGVVSANLRGRESGSGVLHFGRLDIFPV